MIFSNELERTGIYVTVAIFYNSTIISIVCNVPVILYLQCNMMYNV